MPRKPVSVLISLALAALLPAVSGALSTTNSDSADLVLADMALSRGDCRGGTDRYLKAALGTSDAKISERANKVAAECQQINASAKTARRWQKLEPDRAEAAAAVALAAVRLYQPEEAGAAILRTHALGGDEALIKLIGELSDAGGTAITLNTLRPMLDAPDVSDKVLIAGVDLALENFDFATAHKLADRVLANEPASGDARAQLARVLTAEGDTVAAIAIAQEAAALDPETQRFAYADTLLRLDRMDEARQELESLRTDASAREEADLRLGKLAYQMGDMTEAGRRFGSLISSPAVAGEAFFYLSSIAEREGRTDLALEGYTKLAEAGAGLVVRGRAARLMMKANDRDGAFRFLDEFAAKERSEASGRGVRQGRAARRFRQGPRSRRAAAAGTRAISRSPRRALPDRAHPGKSRPGARVNAHFREPAQGPARRCQPAERARIFARRPQARNCRAPSS